MGQAFYLFGGGRSLPFYSNYLICGILVIRISVFVLKCIYKSL